MNEIFAIHLDGQLLAHDIWKQYSDKYGEIGHCLQGWKPPKRFYRKIGHAKNGVRHLPPQIRDKVEIVKYVPEKIYCEYCGEPVDERRKCYVIPTCYKCLPPPPPLPKNNLRDTHPPVGRKQEKQ